MNKKMWIICGIVGIIMVGSLCIYSLSGRNSNITNQAKNTTFIDNTISENVTISKNSISNNKVNTVPHADLLKIYIDDIVAYAKEKDRNVVISPYGYNQAINKYISIMTDSTVSDNVLSADNTAIVESNTSVWVDKTLADDLNIDDIKLKDNQDNLNTNEIRKDFIFNNSEGVIDNAETGYVDLNHINLSNDIGIEFANITSFSGKIYDDNIVRVEDKFYNEDGSTFVPHHSYAYRFGDLRTVFTNYEAYVYTIDKWDNYTVSMVMPVDKTVKLLDLDIYPIITGTAEQRYYWNSNVEPFLNMIPAISVENYNLFEYTLEDLGLNNLVIKDNVYTGDTSKIAFTQAIKCRFMPVDNMALYGKEVERVEKKDIAEFDDDKYFRLYWNRPAYIYATDKRTNEILFVGIILHG